MHFEGRRQFGLPLVETNWSHSTTISETIDLSSACGWCTPSRVGKPLLALILVPAVGDAAATANTQHVESVTKHLRHSVVTASTAAAVQQKYHRHRRKARDVAATTATKPAGALSFGKGLTAGPRIVAWRRYGSSVTGPQVTPESVSAKLCVSSWLMRLRAISLEQTMRAVAAAVADNGNWIGLSAKSTPPKCSVVSAKPNQSIA